MAVQAEAEEDFMEIEHHIAFGPFRLDTKHGRLWRDKQVIGLRPRSLAIRFPFAMPDCNFPH
jgi:hypothetical protein